MRFHHLQCPLENLPDAPDRAVDIHDVSIPRKETNTNEGCEYLDNHIRMEEQPHQVTERPEA